MINLILKFLKRVLSRSEPQEIYTNKLTKDFTIKDVLPIGIKWEDLKPEHQDNLINTLRILQKLKDKLDIKVVINTKLHNLRGFRLKEHQESLIKKKETKAKRSRHLKGCALDVVVSIPTKDFAKEARKVFNTVIEYPNRGFIHLDTDLRSGKKYFKRIL